MYFTSSDIHERNAFAEATIRDTVDFLSQNRDASVELFTKNFSITALLDQAVIPNIRDAVVTLPERAIESEMFPIIAAHSGETIILENNFATQTPTQRKQSLATIASWQPTLKSPAEVMSTVAYGPDDIDAGALAIRMAESSTAITNAMSTVWDLDRSRAAHQYARIPAGRIGRILFRPLITLNMESTTKLEPDVLIHELVHVIQKVHNPVRVIASQKRADMQALREELEAYNVGATVRLRLNNIPSIRDISVEDLGTSAQLAVEAVRVVMNDKEDPFRPSPALLRKLQELDRGHIVQNQLQYDELVAAFDAAS